MPCVWWKTIFYHNPILHYLFRTIQRQETLHEETWRKQNHPTFNHNLGLINFVVVEKPKISGQSNLAVSIPP